MAVVDRKSGRLAAEDRAINAIGKGRKLSPAEAEFKDRLQRVILDVLQEESAFNMFAEAVGAVARFEPELAKLLQDEIAADSTGKEGRPPREDWLKDEMIAAFDLYRSRAEANGEKHPDKVARAKVALLYNLGSSEAVRSIERRAKKPRKPAEGEVEVLLELSPKVARVVRRRGPVK